MAREFYSRRMELCMSENSNLVNFLGAGIMTLAIGTRYSGEFEMSKPNGFGVQSNSNGVVYSGLWENGLKNGTGTLDFGDGTSFVGEFQNGLGCRRFIRLG